MIKMGGVFFSLTFKMVHSEVFLGSLQVHEKVGFIEFFFLILASNKTISR
jgi:hypothetical protein